MYPLDAGVYYSSISYTILTGKGGLPKRMGEKVLSLVRGCAVKELEAYFISTTGLLRWCKFCTLLAVMTSLLFQLLRHINMFLGSLLKNCDEAAVVCIVF